MDRSPCDSGNIVLHDGRVVRMAIRTTHRDPMAAYIMYIASSLVPVFAVFHRFFSVLVPSSPNRYGGDRRGT